MDNHLLRVAAGRSLLGLSSHTEAEEIVRDPVAPGSGVSLRRPVSQSCTSCYLQISSQMFP